MWRLALGLLAGPALAQGFDAESGIPAGGLHPRFPADYACPPITSYYGSWLDVDGSQRDAPHKGLDLGRWGDAVIAPAKATVLAAWATDVGYGPEWNLLLSHRAADMGLAENAIYYSEFDHLGPDVVWLKAGQQVARGEKLATVQVPGGVRAYLPETHWETYRLPALSAGQTYWAENGLGRGFLTWFNPDAELQNPLALLQGGRAATITAFDAQVAYAGFRGFTYPLACVKH